jgi:hypothetical protein
MTFAGSIFLIAIGAILRFATHFHVEGRAASFYRPFTSSQELGATLTSISMRGGS